MRYYIQHSGALAEVHNPEFCSMPVYIDYDDHLKAIERLTAAKAEQVALKDTFRKQIGVVEAERDRLRALLRRYRTETPLGHQPHMIAHEVDAALAGAPAEPDARQLLQTAYDMWAPSLATHPAETNGGWWLRETRRVLGIPEPARIDPQAVKP